MDLEESAGPPIGRKRKGSGQFAPAASKRAALGQADSDDSNLGCALLRVECPYVHGLSSQPALQVKARVNLEHGSPDEPNVQCML